MSGKKVLLLATIFVSIMVAFSFLIIVLASGDNINNVSATKTQAVDKKNILKATVNVEGMTCEACEKTINMITGRVPGVISVKASHVNKSAVVEYDKTQTTVQKIMESIGSTGYKTIGYEDAMGKHDGKPIKVTPEKIQKSSKCGAANKCGAGKCGSK